MVDTASISASDQLNPPGIRTAGIRMIPVMGGQYKVWTKKMGSGPIKVLPGEPSLAVEFRASQRHRRRRPPFEPGAPCRRGRPAALPAPYFPRL